jgi:BirA family biotin operon repressor/biotin-[acetyl-CoA-carboxylase] ligase
VSGAGAPWRLSVHDELASTQDLVLAAAAAGEPEGLAILARRQVAGRGTQGRPWRSGAGNLALSLLWRPGGSAQALPRWSLLAAVALADAVAAELPPGTPLTLKWPNDLLLDGAKCAGILTDAASDGDGTLEWLVLGIGVNLAHAPELPGRRTASLAAFIAHPPEAALFAQALLRRLSAWRGRLEREGFACVREAWLARGPRVGTELSLFQSGTPWHGIFMGLAEDGRLLLRIGGRDRAFMSGEVAG